MNYVYAFLFLTVSLFLSACQTNAQKQYINIRSQVQMLEADAGACLKRIKERPDYTTDREPDIFVDDHLDPDRLKKFRIDRFLTDKEKETILINHAYMSECRAVLIGGWGKIIPAAAENQILGFKEMDDILLELIDENITIGEFNRQFTDNIMEYNNNHRQIEKNTVQELEYAHQNQVQNRQRFTKAFADSMQTYNAQQQRIRERRDYMRSLDRVINRPTTTICNTMGNTLTCNTN